MTDTVTLEACLARESPQGPHTRTSEARANHRTLNDDKGIRRGICIQREQTLRRTAGQKPFEYLQCWARIQLDKTGGCPTHSRVLRMSGVCSIHAALTLAVFSALMLIAAHPAQAQTETVLYNFANSPDGSEPVGGLTSHDGNFYGTTQVGGAHGQGTVFELSPSGVGGWNETVLYNFCSVIGQNGNCDDGSGPQASVIFDNLGTFTEQQHSAARGVSARCSNLASGDQLDGNSSAQRYDAV